MNYPIIWSLLYVGCGTQLCGACPCSLSREAPFTSRPTGCLLSSMLSQPSNFSSLCHHIHPHQQHHSILLRRHPSRSAIHPHIKTIMSYCSRSSHPLLLSTWCLSSCRPHSLTSSALSNFLFFWLLLGLTQWWYFDASFRAFFPISYPWSVCLS